MPVARRNECPRPIRFGLCLWLCLAMTASATDSGGPIDCEAGRAVAADLGDGVVMHTCLAPNAAGELVRAGPLLLVRNGIPILRAQTNRDGRLHGRYLVWDDDGSLAVRGAYRDGRKQGAWLFVGKYGRRTILHYDDGRLVGR